MAALVRREGVAARALEFTILTAARVSEVRFAKAREFNLEKRIWTVPSDRMKGGLVHRVPLSDRAVKILLETGQLDKGGLVFPGTTNHGALSENTQNDVIKQLHEFDVAVEGPGFFDPDSERIATAHGMRSTFKDWARTMTSFPDEASELSLAHVNNDSTRSAYARDELLDIRRTMMEQWSLFCLPPKAENVVVLAAHRKG
jgi:integrase